MIQDLIEQGKMTKASLYNIPNELAVCFDKKFEGELCNILFERFLAKERVKIEAQTKEKERA